ncbi:hypothetical protein Tco_0378958 [Tanacetum coccineum]
MNPQETLQAAARDEKWIPSAERVKISSTNIRLETTMPQKKETFQLVIDIINNSTCFKAFTISADVPEIFMQTILDICLRVEGLDIVDVPDDDTALTFLIDLGYKGEDFQEYGLPIPDIMLTDAIKRSESYQMFIKYSTNQIPPKKSRAKKKTTSRRVVKKKVTLSADDNIISDDLDAALELAKSISQTEAEEAEAARKVHATHARIMTESVSESVTKKSGGRSSKSIVIQDTPSAPKSKPVTSKAKLKGAPSLTPVEQEPANIMQAFKESKKTRRRQLGTGGSNEGTSSKPGVPDESTVIFATSSEGTGAKPGVPDEDKDITKEKVILEWGDEQDSEFSNDDDDDVEKGEKDGDADDEGDDHVSDTQDADDEDVKTESNEDDIYKYKIRVRKDEDEEMKDAEVEGSDKGDEEITNAAKEEAEKTSEAKDDTKKTELPPSSLSLSVSSDVDVSSLLDIPIQHETPQIQSPSVQKILVSVIPKTTNLPPIPENVTETIVTTANPSPQVTPIISTVQQITTPIPTPTITTDAPTITLLFLNPMHSLIPMFQPLLIHLPKLTKKPTPTAEQESEKSPLEILEIKKEQAESQKNPQFTIKSTDKAAFEEYDLKSALYQSMYANKSFNRNPANHWLYHALMEALIEDKKAMDKGVADIVKDHKRKHDDDKDDDDEDPPAGPNQGKKTNRRRTKESESSKKPSSTKETPKGKTLTKGSKTSKSALAKEPVEEPIAEVIMDDAGDDVARDDNPSQDTSEPKTRKTLNPNWFKQPPRPPTPDLEWNKRQVVLDQPAQPWFNQMVSASKDPLTFNDLMATPIDFSKYVLNGLKIDNLTQDILLGPTFNLLKGTCSSIDRYPFDLSKPLPKQGPSDHRTVAVDYFFNNDLKYLKTSDPEVTYTSSIMKTKVARYEIKGIEDMVPTLWSTIKHAYDKDFEKGIKHWDERRKLWYRSQISKFSKKNVYSTKAILGVKSVSVKKLHGYGHLEEIVVKRSNQRLYKFIEGDFVDLHLNDIEDMLLIAVQHKLFHLDGSVIIDFIMPLRMFTKSLILKRRVEDLQLGVEKIIYEDLDKQKRVLRASELCKFSDGTLKSVCDEIHHRVLDFRLDYNKEMPKRKWMAVDQKRSSLMFELIDKQLQEREIIKNLERLVGARELEMDYKLMIQNRRDLPKDIPLVSVKVHRYDIKRSKSENNGIMPAEIELVLEQTQQGHTIERRFKLVGFPPCFKKYSNPAKQSFTTNVDVKSNDKPSSVSPSSSCFTSEQMKKLLSLINDNLYGSFHAIMACRASFFIVNVCANQYLTVSTVRMFNFMDITSLKIDVGHPNGTLATISHTGNLRLANNVILYDVLVVPGYYDLTKQETLGNGSESGGIYLFDMQTDCSWGPYRVPSREGYKSDNGTEFMDSKMSNMFSDLGIIHQTSCVNFKDTLPQALLNKNFLKEHQAYDFK